MNVALSVCCASVTVFPVVDDVVSSSTSPTFPSIVDSKRTTPPIVGRDVPRFCTGEVVGGVLVVGGSDEGSTVGENEDTI